MKKKKKKKNGREESEEELKRNESKRRMMTEEPRNEEQGGDKKAKTEVRKDEETGPIIALSLAERCSSAWGPEYSYPQARVSDPFCEQAR